ncbi:hypothetical protein [Streptomyces misionensis]|uniref:hypothetical protein n=1 Tax=Streptomyces misionensis TaxID=67331 RepID=UPI0036FF8170
MDSTLTLPVAVLAAAHLCSLLSLWLRLRWRARTELAQQACIASLTAAAPGARIEVEDEQDDGRRVRLHVTPSEVLRGRAVPRD